MKNKHILKKVFILSLLVYVAYIFISQQQSLNSYAAGHEYYAMQIQDAKTQNQELATLKENINSPEYIEKIAREKLDMYLPNERVYIDIEQ